MTAKMQSLCNSELHMYLELLCQSARRKADMWPSFASKLDRGKILSRHRMMKIIATPSMFLVDILSFRTFLLTQKNALTGMCRRKQALGIGPAKVPAVWWGKCPLGWYIVLRLLLSTLKQTKVLMQDEVSPSCFSKRSLYLLWKLRRYTDLLVFCLFVFFFAVVRTNQMQGKCFSYCGPKQSNKKQGDKNTHTVISFSCPSGHNNKNRSIQDELKLSPTSSWTESEQDVQGSNESFTFRFFWGDISHAFHRCLSERTKKSRKGRRNSHCFGNLVHAIWATTVLRAILSGDLKVKKSELISLCYSQSTYISPEIFMLGFCKVWCHTFPGLSTISRAWKEKFTCHKQKQMKPVEFSFSSICSEREDAYRLAEEVQVTRHHSQCSGHTPGKFFQLLSKLDFCK